MSDPRRGFLTFCNRENDPPNERTSPRPKRLAVRLKRVFRATPLVLLVLAPFGAGAEPITACTQTGICYCVNADYLAVIQERTTAIRTRLAAERTAGKATGYISIPISTLEGSYYQANIDVANSVRDRIETKFGAAFVWMLNPGDSQWALPNLGAAKPSGADYMLMWTRVLEGASGEGADLDFIWFTGPEDFRTGLNLGETQLMARLDAEYDRRAATDNGIKAVDKRAFRNYYALRASVAFSLGSHDEWNIARGVNEKRRSAGRPGIARQWGIWFDGRPVSPSEYETPAAPGYAGTCSTK